MKPTVKTYPISEISALLGLSADTLRYYEKIKLIPPVQRTPANIRRYHAKDISRLRFIQRAQKMNFSLAEIKDLLSMREDPQHSRHDVRELTHNKLQEIESHLKDLTTLRNELSLLVSLCAGSEGGCPIIEGMEEDTDEEASAP